MENLRKPTNCMKAVRRYSWMDLIKKSDEMNGVSFLDTCQNQAIHKLESLCSARYGFPTDISASQNLVPSVTLLPNVLDSALITHLLISLGVPVSPELIRAVRAIILKNQNETTSLWSYFQNESLIPADIDTSSYCLLALQAVGDNQSSLAELANDFARQIKYRNDGYPDIYINDHLNADISEWLETPRTDLVATTTFAYCLETFKVHDDKLKSVYVQIANLLYEVIKDHKVGEKMLTDQLTTYTQLDLLYFSLARLLPVSSAAREVLKDSLQKVVQQRLLLESENSLSASSKILAAYFIGLFKNDAMKTAIAQQIWKLVRFQKEDGSFEKSSFSTVNGSMFIGSTAVNTAFAIAALQVCKTEFPETYFTSKNFKRCNGHLK